MDNERKNFTHFKIHTQYSICEGAIKIQDLANYCKENKIQSIGLSDSFNLCGALEFSEEISKTGTQPIIGSQINFKYFDTIGKIPIFAKTELGFSNLTKLSSKSYLEVNEGEQPHCLIDDLLKNNKDLIILSGGIDSLFSNLVKKNKIEYVWLDGYKPEPTLRSKIKIVDRDCVDVSEVPEWAFDGSSTQQAQGSDSDCVLKPVRLFDSPFNSDQLVLCEVYNADGTPHVSNSRAKIIRENQKEY